MQLSDDESDVEKYLKKFRPRAIRPLQVPRSTKPRWPVLAAALMMIALGISNWRLSTRPKPFVKVATQTTHINTGPERMNILALTKLAFDDDSAFEEYLVERSRTDLPDMNGKQSALRVLAKE